MLVAVAAFKLLGLLMLLLLGPNSKPNIVGARCRPTEDAVSLEKFASRGRVGSDSVSPVAALSKGSGAETLARLLLDDRRIKEICHGVRSYNPISAKHAGSCRLRRLH